MGRNGRIAEQQFRSGNDDRTRLSDSRTMTGRIGAKPRCPYADRPPVIVTTHGLT